MNVNVSEFKLRVFSDITNTAYRCVAEPDLVRQLQLQCVIFMFELIFSAEFLVDICAELALIGEPTTSSILMFPRRIWSKLTDWRVKMSAFIENKMSVSKCDPADQTDEGSLIHQLTEAAPHQSLVTLKLSKLESASRFLGWHCPDTWWQWSRMKFELIFGI